MKYFYDFEFFEDTMEIISIGIVCEDGRDLYIINANAPWHAILKHEWLAKNVVPHLPMVQGRAGVVTADPNNVDVMAYGEMAEWVKHFFLAPNEPIELWGYYAAYDHVLLTKLLGGMNKQPKAFPWMTMDVQQLAVDFGMEHALPSTLDGTYTHRAIDDARWTKKAYECLIAADADIDLWVKREYL